MYPYSPGVNALRQYGNAQPGSVQPVAPATAQAPSQGAAPMAFNNLTSDQTAAVRGQLGMMPQSQGLANNWNQQTGQAQYNLGLNAASSALNNPNLTPDQRSAALSNASQQLPPGVQALQDYRNNMVGGINQVSGINPNPNDAYMNHPRGTQGAASMVSNPNVARQAQGPAGYGGGAYYGPRGRMAQQ